MLTANELRTRQNNTELSQQITDYLNRTEQEAFTFANTVLNEELENKSRERGRSISWLFITHDYCKGNYVNEIPRIKRAIPVREKIVATKAHRLETVGGIWPGADLDVLKEYLEQHGYQVTIHANVLKEESWSRKSTSVYQGFKMVISWEE